MGVFKDRILHIFSGIKIAANAVVTGTTYAALETENIVLCDPTANAVAVTLPVIADKIYVIKDSGGAAATHNITIAGATGTIDGASTKVISSNYGVQRIYCNGTNFLTL